MKGTGFLRYIAAAVVLAAVTLALHLVVPFIYAVNDDLFMKNIVSGAYLGSPDAHTVYLEYPISLLLSGLYRLMPSVPWYGVVFFGLHLMSWTAIAGRCMRLCQPQDGDRSVSGMSRAGRGAVWKSREGLLASVFLLLIYLCAGFYQIAAMQFTTTAAVLGAAALVWFLTAEDSLPVGAFCRDQLGTAAFVLLSFNVRRNVLLMLVPVAGMLWLGRLLTAGRRAVKKYMLAAALCAAGVAVTLAWYPAAYGSGDWRNYIRFNDNATVLYDYYGWPDYEENRELYGELGISYESFRGAREAYLLSVDGGIDAEAMEALAERSGLLYARENTVGMRIKEAVRACITRMYADADRPLNLIVLSLYALVLGGLALGRSRRGLLLYGCLIFGRTFAWLYVAYEGRYPVRITQSLLLAECAALAVLLLGEALPGYLGHHRNGDRERAGAGRLLFAGGAACCLILLAALGCARVRHAYYDNTRRLEESRDLQDVKDYCADRPENFYFVDTRSVTNDTEEIFDARQNEYENYIVFGGWLSESPVYLDKLKGAGVRDVEKALLEGRALVIFEQEGGHGTGYLEDYFGSKYDGFSMEPVERFGRGGKQFCVYRLKADQGGRAHAARRIRPFGDRRRNRMRQEMREAG